MVERPVSADDPGGLPPSGPITRSAAERAIPIVHRGFRDVQTSIVDVDGRATIRTPEATVEVGQTKWTIIRVTLPRGGFCPMNPLSVDGVPLFFRYRV